MICLKNRTFAVSQTSPGTERHRVRWLWFAWKIVLLQYHKHLSYAKHSVIFRCDLLEKSYFCSITNILVEIIGASIYVVICLKNRTFAVSQTSWKAPSGFKDCCDLLEKSYFCSITNILLTGSRYVATVVICLKNRTFAVSQTSS